MGATDEPVEESDLHAWVDGRQTPGRGKAIETNFAAHPEMRKRWWEYAEQKAALRAAFAALATGPIPAGLEWRWWRQRWFVQDRLSRVRWPRTPMRQGGGNKTRFQES